MGEETEGSVDVSGISASILPNITPVVESPGKYKIYNIYVHLATVHD